MNENKTDKGDAYEQSGNFGIGNMNGGEIKDNAKVAGMINEQIEGNYIQGDYYQYNFNPNSSQPKQKFPKICKNRKALDEYLETVVTHLRKGMGFLDVKSEVIYSDTFLKKVARKTEFNLSFGWVKSRGEAFIILAEFEQINMDLLREFSGRCFKYVKNNSDSSTVGRAVYNCKFPTNLCFAVALVDEIDEKIIKSVQTFNPLKYSVDLLWYEVPIVYDLSKKQLYFYEKPSDWTDHFTGEIAWKEIRLIIQKALIPSN